MLGVVLDGSPAYFFRQGFSFDLELSDWLEWLSNELLGSVSPIQPRPDVTTHAVVPFTRLLGI